MMHTIQTVRAFLESQRESDEPDEVLAILKTYDGRQLTKRILDKLPGGTDRWIINQFATMTHLETRDYHRSGGNTGIHILIAYKITNIMIDVSWIEQNNPAYFAGRRTRNESRDKVANSSSMLTIMADRLNAYADAKAKLEEAKDDLDKLTDYGGPFSADSYGWERLCGARDDS
jgi:hypothetical protein